MAKKLLCMIGGLSFSAAAISPLVNRPKSQNSYPEDETKELKINKAIEKSRKLIHRLKNEVGVPGLVVGVSVDGKVVWNEGFGYADIENEVEAHGETVMRIASISKSLTAAVVARLWQDGVIDIDKPIQTYVPTFPEKTFGNEKVVITTRQLMCHLSGIRHYSKKKKEETVGAGDGQLEEFYSKERYESVEKALAIFKDDDLLYAPGSKFLYTTYGWTLVSAVMEGATGKTYPQIMRAFLREIGMRKTYLDEPDPIIYGRSKCYGKNKNGRIINSPYVDNSCKWAGGGFLSTVGDLLKFSNALLFAFQRDGDIDIGKGSYIMSVAKDNKGPLEVKESIKEEKSMAEVKEAISKKAVPGEATSITTMKSEKNILESKTKQNEVVPEGATSHIVSGVSDIMKGVATGGSQIWEYGSSLLRRDEKTAPEKDVKVKSDSKLQESAEKTKESESISAKATSVIGSGVNIITQGVVTGSSYLWGLGSSLLRRDEKTAPEKDVKVKSESEVQASAEKVKESESISGTVAPTASLDNTAEAKSETQIGQSIRKEKESEVVPKTVASDIISGVSGIMKGLATGGSYIWGYGSSLLRRDEKTAPEKDVKIKSDSKLQESDEEVKEGESISEKATSIIGSGVNNITQGVVTGSSYVWGLGSSLLRRDEKTAPEKDVKVKSESEVQASAEKVKESESFSGTVAPIASLDNTAEAKSETQIGQSIRKEKESEVVPKTAASDIISGVSGIMKGLATGGSYIWDYGSSLLRRDEKTAPEKDVKVKSDSKLQESAEKTKESESISEKATSVIGSGVNYITQGVVTGSSYLWGLGSSLLRRDEKTAPEKDVKVKSDSKLQESDEEVKEGESISEKATSIIGSGVNNITQGVVTGSSYVWGLGSSLLRRDEKTAPEKDVKVKSESEVQASAEKVKESESFSGTVAPIASLDNTAEAKSETQIGQSIRKEKESEVVPKTAASDIISGVSGIMKGLATGGSYIWDYGSSLLRRDEKTAPEKDVKVKSDSKLQESAEKTKESESISEKATSVIGSGVNYITQGVVTGSSYLWGLGSSLLRRDEKTAPEKDVKVKSESEVQASAEKVKESESISEKATSIIGSGVNNVTQGVVTGSSYVWGLGSSYFSREKENDDKKADDSKNKSTISSTSSYYTSPFTYLWKKITFSGDQEDSTKKNDSVDEEDTKSIISLLSNWFKPKALDDIETTEVTPEKVKNVMSYPVEPESGRLFWIDQVISYAVSAVNGNLSRSGLNYHSSDYILNESRNPFISESLDNKPYILPATVAKLWTRVDGTRLSDWGPHVEGGYGLGFGVACPVDSVGGVIDGGQPYIVGHTGGAVGASSAMIIVPRKCNLEEPPKGIAVVILCNLQAVSLNPLAIEIAKLFSNV